MSSFAQELIKSMKQAVAISRGEMPPANVTRFDADDVEAIRAKASFDIKELVTETDFDEIRNDDEIKAWQSMPPAGRETL